MELPLFLLFRFDWSMLIGFTFFFVSLLFLSYFMALKFLGETETGWTSLIASIWLIGGLAINGDWA